MPKCKADLDHLRGFKIQIYPTEEQKERIKINIDVARAVYNLFIDFQNEAEVEGKYIEFFDMCTLLRKLRNTDENYQWLNDAMYSTEIITLSNLNKAYRNYFDSISKHPRYKTKRSSKKSFNLRSDSCKSLNLNYIKVPDIGKLDVKKNIIPIGARLYQSTITFDGDRYWFSCAVEKEPIDMNDIPKSEPLGIDVGYRNLVMTSNGNNYHLPDTYKLERRRSRESSRLTDYRMRLYTENHTIAKYEDMPKSKNMIKLEAQYRKTCRRIANIRRNYIHNMTKEIVSSNPSVIVIEDLSINEIVSTQPWMKNKKQYMLFHEIHRQLQYKGFDRGIPVIKAEYGFPSSKKCSNCGFVRDKLGSTDTYICPVCKSRIDRDLNAAYNLRDVGYQYLNGTYTYV